MEKTEEPEELDKEGKTDAQSKHPGELLSGWPRRPQLEASSVSERTAPASQRVSAAVPHLQKESSLAVRKGSSQHFCDSERVCPLSEGAIMVNI